MLDHVRPAESQHAIKTYRYVRLGMILLVGMIAAAVLWEWGATGRACFQTSISAYYYTPAQAVFVGALVAVGICLIALKGNSPGEDTLLNLAGMMAPVVAFVPTPAPSPQCWSVPMAVGNTPENVANNIASLLIVGAAAFLVVVVIGVAAARRRPAGAGADLGERQPQYVWGFWISVLVYAVFAVSFIWSRPLFLEAAHYTAATTMFAFIGFVVMLNGYRLSTEGDPLRLTGLRRIGRLLLPIILPRNRYQLVGFAMLWSLAVMLIVMSTTGWAHAILWIEIAQIALFVVFWGLQTRDQWNERVVREPADAVTGEPAPAVG